MSNNGIDHADQPQKIRIYTNGEDQLVVEDISESSGGQIVVSWSMAEHLGTLLIVASDYVTESDLVDPHFDRSILVV